MKWYEKQAIELVKKMTLDEKISLSTTFQKPIVRLGIPEFHIGGEAAHGIVSREGVKTTSFPTPLILSQTWNPKLLNKIGTIISDEARALYNKTGKTAWLMPWAPTIDLERDPFWGRNEEGYGEDPTLTSKLSGSLIDGIQGNDDKFLKTVATPKHFYGNNNEKGREDSSNTITPRNKYEYYLLPFQNAIQNHHAASMMTAYNGINGYPGMQNPDLNLIVKNQWHMDGFIVTDGGALTLNIEDYQYYTDYVHAVADAINRGIDCFVDDDYKVEPALKQAVLGNLVSKETLDRAIKNILMTRIHLGQMAQQTPFDNLQMVGSAQSNEVVKTAITEGSVLLKNRNNLLPLSKREHVIVTGPLANHFVRDWYAAEPVNRETIAEAVEDNKQFSYENMNDIVKLYAAEDTLSVNQNGSVGLGKEVTYFEKEQWGKDKILLMDVNSKRYLTYNENTKLELGKSEVYAWNVREAFTEKNGVIRTCDGKILNVVHGEVIVAERAFNPLQIKRHISGNNRVQAVAKQNDTVIYVAGNHPMLNGKETEDRDELGLPINQVQQLKMIHSWGNKIIMVIEGGYSFNLEKLNFIDSIIFTGYAAQSLGSAIVEMLTGITSPTGKLSQTWYKEDQLPVNATDYDLEKSKRTYRYVAADAVIYPFGYGLSYYPCQIDGIQSTFNGSVDGDKCQQVTLTVNPHVGKVGQDTVQLYALISDPTDRFKPTKRLLAFKKINISDGQPKQVVLEYNLTSFEFYNTTDKTYYYPLSANIKLSVGFSSGQLVEISHHVVSSKKIAIGNEKIEPMLDILSFVDYQAIEINGDKKGAYILSLQPDSYITYTINHPVSTIELHYDMQENGSIFIEGIQEKGIKKIDLLWNESTKSIQFDGAFKINKIKIISQCALNIKEILAQ